ncbi:MAG TPA: hypothetical protein VEL07_00455 [Planctomycetota bacterium]|nr:hypothetical protein [Planctomycetota bacterium]
MTLATLLGALLGCGRAPQVAERDERVVIRAVAYRGWSDAWSLSDGRIELVIVPGVARVMRLGRIDGPNLLWEDAALDGPDADPAAALGGGKTWPWPYASWKQVQEHWWPAPFPRAAYRADIVDGPHGSALRLTGPDHAATGTRVVETFAISAAGAIEVESRLLRLRDDAPAFVPWYVLQMAPPESLHARRVAGSTLPDGWTALMGAPEVRASAAWIRLPTRAAQQTKVGIDGDALIWVRRGDALVFEHVAHDAAAHPPGEALQSYVQSGDPAAVFVELEATAPPGVLVLRTRWRLIDLDPGLALDQRILHAQQAAARPAAR